MSAGQGPSRISSHAAWNLSRVQAKSQLVDRRSNVPSSARSSNCANRPPCFAVVFSRPPGKRRILAIATGALAALAALAMIPAGPDQIAPNGLFMVFGYGFFGFQILANFTANR